MGESRWHAPQQQHAGPWPTHGVGNAVQGWPARYWPPICAHEPWVSCWQMPEETMQHEPVVSWAHCCGLHAPPGPYHVPFLFTQSQLEAVTQLLLRQHTPKRTWAGHRPGAQG